MYMCLCIQIPGSPNLRQKPPPRRDANLVIYAFALSVTGPLDRVVEIALNHIHIP